MVTNEKCNHLASLKQDGEALFHALIGSIQEIDERHINALQDVIKSGKAIKSTFETMKQIRKVTKMEPVFKETNKNMDTQRRFFSMTKRRKIGNIRHAKPTDNGREDFVNSIDVEEKKHCIKEYNSGSTKGMYSDIIVNLPLIVLSLLVPI